MKKVIILFVMLVNCAISFAQSVLGIPFGSTYNNVKTKLQERVGAYSVYEENGSLSTGEINVGDFPFDYSEYKFQYDGKISYFSYAYFEKHYKVTDVTMAKDDRDFLLIFLKKKYKDDIVDFINDQGFKCYRFGSSTVEPDRWLGTLILKKGTGKDGKMRLYIELYYGPLHYIDSSSDF